MQDISYLVEAYMLTLKREVDSGLLSYDELTVELDRLADEKTRKANLRLAGVMQSYLLEESKHEMVSDSEFGRCRTQTNAVVSILMALNQVGADIAKVGIKKSVLKLIEAESDENAENKQAE